MRDRRFVKCEHEMDEATMKFVEGKGLVGFCVKCGAPLIQARFTSVRPRRKPKMSKKQRIRERNRIYESK